MPSQLSPSTLAPGNYTAIVTGVNNTTGYALVELYGLQLSDRGNYAGGSSTLSRSLLKAGGAVVVVCLRAGAVSARDRPHFS